MLEGVKKIYFIGIGGIGMSAAAGLASKRGFMVAGSDKSQIYPPVSLVLEKYDIHVNYGYAAENISNSDADLYVISAGEGKTNPEVDYVLSHGLKFCSFPEILRELAHDKTRIVVTGTHGKSTTSGLLGFALRELSDASFMVGAVLQNYNDNFHAGSGPYFVFEGDEYKSLDWDNTPKMRQYGADMLIINNLELDHPDMFADLEVVKDEFRKVVAGVPKSGVIFYNADDGNVREIVSAANCQTVSFGVGDWDYKLSMEENEQSGAVTVKASGEVINLQSTVLFGKYNLYNMLAATSVLYHLKFSPEIIANTISKYSGVKRRFEILQKEPFVIVNDYAHHPTAVGETLRSARKHFPEKKLWAVYEPHTYSRTMATIDLVAESFRGVDEVVLAPIYGAREGANATGVTSTDVLREAGKYAKNARLVASEAEAWSLLRAEVGIGDVVVVMAVGSFGQLATKLAS